MRRPDLEPAYAGHDPYRFPFFTTADRLRKALEVAGISNAEMAEYLGVSPNTITNLVRGKVQVKRQTMLLWALRTGVSLVWLEDRGREEDEWEQEHQAHLLREELAASAGLETYETAGSSTTGRPSRTRRDSNPKPSDWESLGAILVALVRVAARRVAA